MESLGVHQLEKVTMRSRQKSDCSLARYHEFLLNLIPFGAIFMIYRRRIKSLFGTFVAPACDDSDSQNIALFT